MEKLRPDAAALGAIVHFELDSINRALVRGAEPLPPGGQRLDHEVAGLGRTPEGHKELGSVFSQNATRNIVLRAAKVMVARLVLSPRFSPARKRPQLDCGFTVHAYPLDPREVLARLVFF